MFAAKFDEHEHLSPLEAPHGVSQLTIRPPSRCRPSVR